MRAVAAGDGGEVRVAHLDGDGAGREPLAFQPRRAALRQPVELAADDVGIGEIGRIRVLRAGRLHGAMRGDRAIVHPVGEPAQPVGPAADRALEHAGVGGAHVDELDHPGRPQPFRGDRADPQSASTGSFRRKASTRSVGMIVRPSGLSQSEAIFARNLLGAGAGRYRQPDLVAHPLLQAPGHRRGQRLAPGVPGDVQIRLVEREGLDEGRDRPVHVEDAGRDLPIAGEIGRHDGQARAQAHRPRHRNRRAHPELPGLVARGGDHPAPVRPPPDRHRPAAQRRVVALLHRCVERIHVEVEDAAYGRSHGESLYLFS